MFINKSLIQQSEQRFKDAKFSPETLDKKLGDGPLDMTDQQKQRRYRQLLAETDDAVAAQQGLERIIQGNDLDSINYLAKGTRASHSICRIQLKDSGSNLIGYASGFLIGPGVLMTNHHVFGSPDDAVNSLADFDYELDVNGDERQSTHFRFTPSQLFYTNDKLDYSIVAVAPVSVSGGRDLSDWAWLPLNGEPGKADPGEYLTIAQHPGGQLKQVCVRENKLLKYVGDFVWYMTDTTAGSSGSPAFNRFWQVVALHHSGVPKKDSQGRMLTTDGRVWDSSMDETLIDWIANEGVRISAIVADLKMALPSHPLVKPVLAGQAPPAPDEKAPASRTTFPVAGTGASRGRGADLWVEERGDEATLVVPVRIPIPFVRQAVPGVRAADAGSGAGRDRASAPMGGDVGSASAAGVGSNGLPVEAVHIDQSTLNSRPGYIPTFLGKGALAVPLPKIPASLKPKIATLLQKSSQSELKYFNYSVVMNKARKLAFFSAVNVDGGKQQDVGKREGDSWLRDPRIDAKFQIGDEFYRKQASFEADRTANPFDRGHLVRRLDATWGDTVDEAKEHGDDSFHFTNCSPQFWSYNQGKQLWAGLEDYTRNILLKNSERGIVMNGPVFDGPDAEEDNLPDPDGDPRKDPIFGGVIIPKYFWKILITKNGSGLKAAAFMISQRNLIMEIDRIQSVEELSAARVRLFQVSIGDLVKLTGLDFGPLSQADAHEATAVGPRIIESFDDIRI
jgi:endonuclease G